jgi:aspartate/methionine/tyrosine aminotransferase
MISDEIYHGITFGAPVGTAWHTSREAIVVNSFSKYWSMTGWRLGWALVPAGLRDAVGALAGNFALCPPAPAQVAALGAFEPDAYAEVDRHVARYRRNRDVLLAGLPQLGIDRLAPADGGFYVYADVSDVTDDTMVFCSKLLADTGLAIAPGIDFDPVDGHRFVRFSCAGATEDMHAALARLRDWLPGSRG